MLKIIAIFSTFDFDLTDLNQLTLINLDYKSHFTIFLNSFLFSF